MNTEEYYNWIGAVNQTNHLLSILVQSVIVVIILLCFILSFIKIRRGASKQWVLKSLLL